MRWNVRAIPSRARLCGDLGEVTRPSKVTRPPSGRNMPEEAVEERRLAGAVRTDQADDLAVGDVEADGVERGDPCERLLTPDASKLRAGDEGASASDQAGRRGADWSRLRRRSCPDP